MKRERSGKPSHGQMTVTAQTLHRESLRDVIHNKRSTGRSQKLKAVAKQLKNAVLVIFFVFLPLYGYWQLDLYASPKFDWTRSGPLREVLPFWFIVGGVGSSGHHTPYMECLVKDQRLHYGH